MAVNPEFNPFEPPVHRKGASVADFAAPDPKEKSYEESVIEYINGDCAEEAELDLETESEIGFSDAVMLGERYAAALLGGVLTLIDMRRAWESILYDRYIILFDGSAAVSQQLLFLERMVLSADDYSLIKESADEFAICGFDIGFGDELTIDIRAVPADFTSLPISDTIYGLLDAVRDRETSVRGHIEHTIAATMARLSSRSKIKPLSHEEIMALLKELERSSDPNFTPSGKKIMVAISGEEIKKMFN
jgi:DNA mismatch repair protein MutL